MSKKEHIIHLFEGIKIPVDIYYENRKNIRASIGKKSAILRLPHFLPPSEKKKHWQWFENFLKKNKNFLAEKFQEKKYNSGDKIQTFLKKYILEIEHTNTKSHFGNLNNGIIHLKINTTQETFQEAIKTLLSRIIAADHQALIERKVKELNYLYFKVPIGEVNLKYTTSRWGSCSSKGNINLSTKLLFAPEDVINYVIIHELAHRKEMNHSPRFWKLVATAMPDYKEKEMWLKVNGKYCDF